MEVEGGGEKGAGLILLLLRFTHSSFPFTLALVSSLDSRPRLTERSLRVAHAVKSASLAVLEGHHVTGSIEVVRFRRWVR